MSVVMRQIGYNVESYYPNGFVINTIMSKWKFARVNGNGNFVIEGISPNDKTADFRVILRSTQYGNFYGIDAQNQENKTQFD